MGAMRAPPSWLLPAIVAAVIVVAAVLQLRKPDPPSPERPRRSAPTEPEPERKPMVRTGAPTPEIQQEPRTVKESLPSAEKTIEEWRIVILRKDPRGWTEMQGMILREWSTYQEHVIRLAGTDENERVRAVNLRLLGSRKNAEFIPLFVERLEKDPSDFVQENCCWALGELAAKDHAALVRRFVTDDSTAVAAAAKEALRRMGAED